MHLTFFDDEYVSHPDIINYAGPEEIYYKHMNELSLLLKEKNIPVEINLGGFQEKFHYPSKRFVELCIKNDNSFIIGVDAHDPAELLNQEVYEEAVNFVTSKGGIVIYNK